jgi:UDP-glucose 4-epimerase
MKILVTGGAGFIGSHIVERIIAEGMDAVVLDNLSSGRKENINPRAVFYEADIRDKSVSDIFRDERPDVVCHQAAQVSVRNSVDDPCADAGINVVGSLNILENCRMHGIKKFLFASTGGAIYGEQEVFPAPEGHPAHPLCPYGAAKLAVENYLFYYLKIFGLPYVALRYANVYGPRQDPHGEAGVVAIFTGKMLAGEAPVINGDGGQTRDYVYVQDVVAANVLAMKADVTGAFNVGTGNETSVNALYETLAEKTGYKGGKSHGPAKAGEQYRSVLDNSLIKKVFGWAPGTPLDSGLEETVAYFRARAISNLGTPPQTPQGPAGPRPR